MNVHGKFMARESGAPGRVSLGVSFGLPASHVLLVVSGLTTPASRISYFYKHKNEKVEGQGASGTWMLGLEEILLVSAGGPVCQCQQALAGSKGEGSPRR